jgi:hypothetical protein
MWVLVCAAMLALSVAVFVSRASAQKDCVMANACMECGVVSARRKSANHLLENPKVGKWMVCNACFDVLHKFKLARVVLPKEVKMDFKDAVVEVERQSKTIIVKIVAGKVVIVPNREKDKAFLEPSEYAITELGSSDNLEGFHGNVPWMLDEILAGKKWKLWSMPLQPRDNIDIPYKSYDIGWSNEDGAERVRFFEAIKFNCADLLVRDNKIIFVKTEEPSQFYEDARAFGIDIFTAARTDKRRVLNVRGISVYGSFDAGSITINVIESEGDDKLIDGFGAISVKMLERMKIETYLRHPKEVADRILARMERTRQYNMRVMIPGIELVKCDCVVVDMEEDFRFTSPSIKTEMTLTGNQVKVCLEPNGGKNKANMNPQHTVVSPWVFGLGKGKDFKKSFAWKWFVADLAKVFSDLAGDRLHEDCEDLLEAFIQGRVASSNTTLDKFKLAVWYANTKSVRSLPSILFRVTKAQLGQMVDLDSLDLKIEIPNSLYGNLISQSMANRILGAGVSVKKGTAQYLAEYKMVVISDDDYLANYANFGGCDGDDKFTVMFRKWLGKVAIYCHRNPSGIGEFAVFTFAGKLPAWVDETTLEDLPDVIPAKLSEMAPVKELEKAAPIVRKSYTWETALRTVHNTSEGPGVLVNCVRLWDMAYSGIRNHFTASTEAMIDACGVKSGKQIGIIFKDCLDMTNHLVNDKEVKIDGRLWSRVRGIYKNRKTFEDVTAKLEADGRFEESWFNELLIGMEAEVKDTIGLISDEITAGRRYVDFTVVSDTLPVDAMKMVRDRYKTMVRCFWYMKKDNHNQVLPLEWVRARAEVAKQLADLQAQFVVWGLDPELQLFAALGKEATKLPFNQEHILVGKDMWERYLKTVVAVTTTAQV